MKLFFGFLSVVLVGGVKIAYRNYKKGDSCDDPIFKAVCPKKQGIPCYVAVNLDVKRNNVLGYIIMDIPARLSHEEEAAVRSKMSNPKKPGGFGYIKNVEVSEAFRGQGIGTRLIKYSIKLGIEAGNIVATTLLVDAENQDAIRLYKRLGFIEVIHDISDIFMAFYL
ncbi:hypothetical protein FOL47_001591 [Perkinsus chesapeaki]|uniref:N-acetyltransferase domain-containing protein n=1 Tax=Perkinsus chesapeaki TaxID=330153 RepID=A0A7J6MIL0_PERCH|nr:hypothetical protein FOL47_001591 [Perkinsus chesapeaki]